MAVRQEDEPAFTTAPVRALRRSLEAGGHWTPHQVATRRWAIGCVSLEVTQRCNLDCTLCYLSEHAEAMRDPPLADLLDRIDSIAATFGPNTDVQISGGEPTLRSRDDLVRIVARIRERGLRSSLFTNGIRATRELLATLAVAGLTDVAFHVDMTQRRKGYASEAELDAVRRTYIERARGLGLQVFFNTTVFAGNLDAVPGLVRFFGRHADVVRFSSFQLGADTGRGVLEDARTRVTREAVIAGIREGAGIDLAFDALLVGHPACNRAAMALVAGGQFVDLLGNRPFAAQVMRRTRHVVADRRRPVRTAAAFAGAVLRQPDLAWQGIKEAARLAWRLRHGLLRARGRVGKLTFFLHSFMDATALDRERVDACVFMAATPGGFLSMCEFNARRDEILLPPRTLADGTLFDPLAGRARAVDARPERVYPIRFLKGRPRLRALAACERTGSPRS